ncbi:MAG: hypothetical protein ACYCUV_05260 [Phycisphaerae bacterium]
MERTVGSRKKHILMILAALALAAVTGICQAGETQYLAQDAWIPGDNVESLNQGFIENKSWVRNDSSPAQISMLDFSGRLRLADTGRYSPTVAYDSTYIGLGTSSALLPRQLNDEAMSLGIPIGQFGAWGVGIALGAGYAGNSPFNDPSAIYGMARITVQHKLWKHTELDMALDYSGNRQFMPDVPLPSVEVKHDQKALDWTVGFPYEAMRWNVLPRLWLNVNYFPIDSGTAAADYSILRWLVAYAEFDSDSWAFHVSSYQSDQRLFFTQCRVQTGFKLFSLHHDLRVDIGGGYAFNQAFSQGFDVRNELPVAQIANAAYVMVSLNASF